MLGFSPLASAPISAAGYVVRVASFDASEAVDTSAVSVNVTASASLSATEATDTASVSVAITATASLAGVEASDTASATIAAVTLVNLAATGAQDIASVSAQIDPANAALAATEAPDTAAFQTSVFATVTLAASEATDSASGGAIVQWAVIPPGASVWAQQNNGVASWQPILSTLPASNTPYTGGPVASASVAGAPIAAIAQSPATGAIGGLWTQPPAGVVYWNKIEPLAPQPNSLPTGALGGAPVAGIATADGLADTPGEAPGSAIWTPVQPSFTPTQQAA